jgi:hypothetical protein
VLSYVQFRNRECLLAWRQRRREHEAASGEDRAVLSTRSRMAPTTAKSFAGEM